MQTRRLSERKPRTSKTSTGEFPGFPSQNDPTALNSLADAREFEGQEAPGNVDYGAVLDSLASGPMSVRTRQSSRPQSASSHSSRSSKSEDRKSPLKRTHPPGCTPPQRNDGITDGASMEAAESATHVALPRSVVASSTASGRNSAGDANSLLALVKASISCNVAAQISGRGDAGLNAAHSALESEIPSAPKRACAAVVTASKQPPSEHNLADKVWAPTCTSQPSCVCIHSLSRV